MKKVGFSPGSFERRGRSDYNEITAIFNPWSPRRIRVSHLVAVGRSEYRIQPSPQSSIPWRNEDDYCPGSCYHRSRWPHIRESPPGVTSDQARRHQGFITQSRTENRRSSELKSISDLTWRLRGFTPVAKEDRKSDPIRNPNCDSNGDKRVTTFLVSLVS